VEKYQKEKKISETGCESRERKLEEFENKILLLALVIGHAALSSGEDNSVSLTELCECFQQCHISCCTLLPLRFALFLNNVSGLY